MMWSQKEDTRIVIVHKVIHFLFSDHLSLATILATTKNIMNILIFLGGNYQKFTKETEKFYDLKKSAIAQQYCFLARLD